MQIEEIGNWQCKAEKKKEEQHGVPIPILENSEEIIIEKQEENEERVIKSII